MLSKLGTKSKPEHMASRQTSLRQTGHFLTEGVNLTKEGQGARKTRVAQIPQKPSTRERFQSTTNHLGLWDQSSDVRGSSQHDRLKLKAPHVRKSHDPLPALHSKSQPTSASHETLFQSLSVIWVLQALPATSWGRQTLLRYHDDLSTVSGILRIICSVTVHQSRRAATHAPRIMHHADQVRHQLKAAKIPLSAPKWPAELAPR